MDDEIAAPEEAKDRASRRAATHARILDAARSEFGDRGFEATTVREVARKAGVDPSLVLQHYGSKAALFTAAISLPADEPGEAVDHLAEVIGVRAGPLPPEMRAVVRSMLTAPDAAQAVREHLDERITNLAASIGGDDAELLAAVVVSSVLGLTLGRHFLGLRSVSDATDEDLIRVAVPALTAGVKLPRSRRRSP